MARNHAVPRGVWEACQTGGFSPCRSDRVKISTPSAVMPAECSNCAAAWPVRRSAITGACRMSGVSLLQLKVESRDSHSNTLDENYHRLLDVRHYRLARGKR